jgi:transcriptional regulator with XRE-family HTH domain
MSPVNVPAIGSYIREQREQAKISLRQLAQAAGVSNPYLSQIERGLRRPSADILQQIARGLRISAEALYVQAGFLEDRPPGLGVHDAVLADPELTERQKQMLLEVYESFRKETAADNQAQPVVIGRIELGGEPAPPAAVDADDAAEADAGPAWQASVDTGTANGVQSAGSGPASVPEPGHDRVA